MSNVCQILERPNKLNKQKPHIPAVSNGWEITATAGGVGNTSDARHTLTPQGEAGSAKTKQRNQNFLSFSK